MSKITLIFPILFLLSASAFTAWTQILQLLGRIRLKKEFEKKPYTYFFYSLTKRLFPRNHWDSLFYLLSFTKHLLLLLYATTLLFSLVSIFPNLNILISIGIVAIIGLLFDFLFRFFASLNPHLILILINPLTSFFFLLFFPITFLFLKAQKYLQLRKTSPTSAAMQAKLKDKILELVHESELSILLDPLDKRLISSVASFRDRIVREIMVPRIDVFSLSVNQTVHEAAKKFITEGYSRIPIYRDNVDSIVGVLLYKDVMEYYFHSIENGDPSPLKTPLEQLVKPVLYTPETKKISELLQEFRKKQIHLAIVVDEYGGTDGIVTIEDILEELVGEIADEFDIIEEEKLYTSHAKGGWIIEARMSIIDIEKELNISIPQSPDYDTIGGYVFHRAGTIPSKGWKIHSDLFDLEVLSSSDRTVETVLLIPSSEKTTQ